MTKKFLMAVLTALTGVTVASATPARAQEAAIELYKDYNFSGEVLRLDSPGYHALPYNFNDQVSSLVIPSGYTVTLYEERNQAGRAVNLGAGRHNISGFNDLVSSLVIKRVVSGEPNVSSGKPGVEFFQDYDFGGQSLKVDNLGYYPMPSYFNERVSSLIVPEGYEVTLYEEYNQAGRSIKLGAGRHNISRFNDIVSSVVIKRAGDTTPGNPDTSGKKEVQLYDDLNYRGDRIIVDKTGYYAFPRYFDNRLSSVVVPKGLEVTLFEHYDRAGRSIVLRAGRHNLGDFNDIVSSMVVRNADEASNPGTEPIPGRREVQFYDDMSFRGDRIVVDKTGYFAFPRYFDNRLSSVIVPKGYEVTLYDNYNQGGNSIVLRPGRHNLNNFNDMVSSVVVRRIGEDSSNPSNPSNPQADFLKERIERQFVGRRIEQVVRQLRFAGYRPSASGQGQVGFDLANLDGNYRVTLNYNSQSNLVESVDVR
jgi:Peptidase inhibitor family I36